ncbi:MAG: 50S ribosomal protein L15 [Dehalococcoidia bacterium]|nr:50S ribosomal protein L15 [Dehalococcoidia bacterium]
MKQHELALAFGARKFRKRVGRGAGSGHGTYSGRGCKGNKARAGFGIRPGFEGGQLPIIKRLPEKRGFTNLFKKEISVVNVSALNCFRAGSSVTPETLLSEGLIKTTALPVKILAGGEIKKALMVKVGSYSAAAKEKIETAGGTAEEVA